MAMLDQSGGLEELLSQTFEDSFTREKDQEEEEERLRQFAQAAQANPAMVGSAQRATPTRRGGTGWVPTARPAKMMARNAAPEHPAEDKENAPRNTRSSLGGSARKAASASKPPAQAQVASSGRRASPRQRAGTGRAVTARDAAFVRRLKQPTPEPEPEPEPVRAELLPNRGRRTGLRLRQEIQKDEFGLEDVSEFWDAEEEVTIEASVHSRRVSFKPSLGSMSPVSHRTSTTGRRSSGHSLTSNTSVAGSELPTDMDESSDMEVDASPVAESSRRSSLRSSSSAKSKGSDLDSSMVSPDSDTIRKISFDGGSGNRSRSSAASSRRSEAEEEQEPSVDQSMGQEEEQEEEPEQPSFDDRPDDDDMGMDESVEEDKSRRPSDIFSEADKAGEEEERKRKRDANDGSDGRKRELDALARAGRASYAATDTYAPKAGRLSMFAPRPEVDEEDTTRRSKRRKMRPLEYWRNERVVYQRVNKSPHTPRERGPRYKGTPKAAVPEIVDIQIRSPAATPWRRNAKPKKEQQATDSVDSKSHTVKKAARKQKKKAAKADKGQDKKGKKRVVQAESSDDDEGEEQAPPAEAPASSKKAKAAKAPSPKAPKAPSPKDGEKRKTAFFLFCKEKRPDVRRSHPNASIPEQAMVLSEMWRGMTDGAKDHYRGMVAAA